MFLLLCDDVRENGHDHKGARIVGCEKYRCIVLNAAGVQCRHHLVEEVGDSRDQHKERDVQQLYEPSLDWEDGHVAGVDYPAGDQYEKDEEKLCNVSVDIARAG